MDSLLMKWLSSKFIVLGPLIDYHQLLKQIYPETLGLARDAKELLQAVQYYFY